MSNSKSNFTPAEIADRIELVKPIVEGAFAIRKPGQRMEPDVLEADARSWEMALRGVATEHLGRLQEVGMMSFCQTAKEFYEVWRAQVNRENEARAHAAQQKRFDEVDSRPAADPNYLAEISARFNRMAKESQISRRRSVVI